MKFEWLNKGTRLDHHLQNDGQNNFTFIRLIAALIVVKQHSFSSTAPNSPDALMSIIHVSTLGLPSFFFISGLLVSQSLEKSNSWKNFLWKRFLRIYPAACFSILCCALILGPLVTSLDLKSYFTNGLLYQFLSSCSLLQIRYELPGVFEHSLIGHSSINSSLWTVSLELKLYLGLLFFWLIKIPGKRYFLFLLIISFLIAGQIYPDQTDAFIYRLMGRHINVFGEFICIPIFLLGVAANIYKQQIIVKNYWLLIILALFISIINFQHLGLLVFLFVILTNLFVATKGINLLKKITPKADLSYGIYVFAFPFQQVVANYFYPTNSWSFFLLTMLCVLPFAIFSWYMIEKKALRLKRLVA